MHESSIVQAGVVGLQNTGYGQIFAALRFGDFGRENVFGGIDRESDGDDFHGGDHGFSSSRSLRAKALFARFLEAYRRNALLVEARL